MRGLALLVVASSLSFGCGSEEGGVDETTRAIGTVAFTRPSAAAGEGVLPAGHQVSTASGVVFELDKAVAFSADDLGPLTGLVTAVESGTKGNVAADTIVQFVDSPFDSAITVNNPIPAEQGGLDPAEAPTPGGFDTPRDVTYAWKDVDGSWVRQGRADWSCLGTPGGDQASTVAITLSGRVNDFQSGNAVPNATVEVFDVVDFGNPHDTVTAGQDGAYSVALPVGVTRVGFKVTAQDTMPSYTLNQYFEPGESEQSFSVNSVSELTANALPAFIGVTRTPGLGVLAGAIRDCSDNEVSGAIATVSRTSGSISHLEGAETYYFSAGSTSLPVRHNQQGTTNTDSLYVVIELPPSDASYLQVWGFVDLDDLKDGEMTLLGEIPSPVLPDSVITSSIEPLRTP